MKNTEKSRWAAALLAIFPLTGLAGWHYLYLEKNKRFCIYFASFSLSLYIITEYLYIYRIQAMITMMMFFTILNWYNAYCYIQFGMTPDERGFDSASRGENFVKKWFDERGLTPQEEKRMTEHSKKVMGKYAGGEYDDYLEEERQKEEKNIYEEMTELMAKGYTQQEIKEILGLVDGEGRITDAGRNMLYGTLENMSTSQRALFDSQLQQRMGGSSTITSSKYVIDGKPTEEAFDMMRHLYNKYEFTQHKTDEGLEKIKDEILELSEKGYTQQEIKEKLGWVDSEGNVTKAGIDLYQNNK